MKRKESSYFTFALLNVISDIKIIPLYSSSSVFITIK